MASELNTVELDVTREIINIGISKAADSFSFFIKGKVMIRLLEIKVNFEKSFPLSRKYPSSRNYLLTTDIKGELQGRAYLLFNEQEADMIADANLPAAIRDNPVERAKMRDAFLLEIDNIITASVVTQFSNIFRRKIYGDVPQLDVLAGHEINEYLTSRNNRALKVIYFNARFVTESVELNPEFIWLMDDNFFTEVKTVLGDQNRRQLLKQLTNEIQ